MTEIITSSRLKVFNACRRLHHYQYALGYRPVVSREAAEFGTIFHAGLEAWWLAHAAGRVLTALSEAQAAIAKAAHAASTLDEVAAVKAELLMVGYDARWAPTMGEYDVIGVEQEFAAPLPTPVNARRARGLKVAGKLDVLVRKRSDGTVWIVEHKTTTADLSPGSTYWQRLRMDTQVSVYFEGATLLGHPPSGCLYDVVSKPQQCPFKATPPEKRKYTKAGALYANQRAEDETIEEFRARMAEEIAGAPELFFQREEVVRLEHELEESRRDTYDTAMMIRDSRRLDRSPRNPDACFLFNRQCDFYAVCCGTADLSDESMFRRLGDNVHPELAQR
jgi:hypothetical protein